MTGTLGLKFSSTHIYSALVDMVNGNPTLPAKGDHTIPSNQTPGEFADWAETQIDLIVQASQPDQIRYKLTSGLAKHDQIFGIYFAIAILNLAAFKAQVPISYLTPTQLQATAFGLPRRTSLDAYISSLFPNQPSPWNSNVREAVAIALRGLL